jgi:hypothetical protein
MDSMEPAGCVHFHDANSLSKKLTLETDKPRGVPWYGGLSPGPLSPMAEIFMFEPIHVRNYVLFQDNVPPSAFVRSVTASSAVTPLSSQSEAPTSQPTDSTPKTTTSTVQSHPSGRSSESGTGSSAPSHGSSLPRGISQYTLRNSNEHQPQATIHAPAPPPQAAYHHPPELPTITPPRGTIYGHLQPGGIYGYLKPKNPGQSSQVPPPNPQSLPSQTASSAGETANPRQKRVDSNFSEEEEARKRARRELPTQEGSSITGSRTPRNDMRELKERLPQEKEETMKLPDGPSDDQGQKE